MLVRHAASHVREPIVPTHSFRVRCAAALALPPASLEFSVNDLASVLTSVHWSAMDAAKSGALRCEPRPRHVIDTLDLLAHLFATVFRGAGARAELATSAIQQMQVLSEAQSSLGSSKNSMIRELQQAQVRGVGGRRRFEGSCQCVGDVVTGCVMACAVTGTPSEGAGGGQSHRSTAERGAGRGSGSDGEAARAPGVASR